MSDIHALSGAYAVNALDDTEREQFEQHLAGCPDCRAEVQSFGETAAMIAGTQAETAPPSLRDSVLSGIASTRPLPPATPTPEAPTDPAAEGASVTPLWRRTGPLLVAASVALILVGLGIFGFTSLRNDGGSSTTNLADQVLNASDAMKVTEPLEGGGQLTIVRSESLGRAVMLGKDVPPPAAGKTYQLWLQQPGEGMVSAGLMPDVTTPTVLTGDAATATAAAVSVEPAVGSAQPTSDPIALFPLQATAENGTT